MSVFAEFLFDGSTTTSSSSRSDPAVHNHNNDDEDDLTTSASVGNNNNYLASSWSTEYGDLLEGMVVGLLEMQQETSHQQQQQQHQQHHQQREEETSNDEDSASYFDGRTIVSSSPSEVTMGEDPIINGQARVSRVPSYTALSLSTASSNFLTIEQDQDHDVASLDPSVSQSNDVPWRNNNFLSFRTGVIPSIHGIMRNNANTIETVTITTNNSSDDTRLSRDLVPSTAMVTTTTPARVLASSSSSNPRTVWYDQFNDADWDAFRKRVQMIQRSLVGPLVTTRTTTTTKPTMRILPLPPRIPALVWDDHGNINNSIHSNGIIVREEEDAEMVSNAEKALQCGLPDCFLCPLCQDILVGAISLDCGCQTHVCAACWEYRCCIVQRQQEQRNEQPSLQLTLALELDYVLVPVPRTTRQELQQQQQHRKSPICPCCYQEIIGQEELRGCHALDVAISQLMIQQVVQHHATKQHHYFYSVWESYRQRVEQWRAELVRRQVEVEGNDGSTLYEEHHLAQLIEEEEAFWKGQEQEQQQQQRRRRQHVVATAMPGLWGISVAVVAALGMKLLLTQSIRAILNGRP
jgi:hypothetical protein